MIRYFHIKEVSPSGWVAIPNRKIQKVSLLFLVSRGKFRRGERGEGPSQNPGESWPWSGPRCLVPPLLSVGPEGKGGPAQGARLERPPACAGGLAPPHTRHPSLPSACFLVSLAASAAVSAVIERHADSPWRRRPAWVPAWAGVRQG